MSLSVGRTGRRDGSSGIRVSSLTEGHFSAFQTARQSPIFPDICLPCLFASSWRVDTDVNICEDQFLIHILFYTILSQLNPSNQNVPVIEIDIGTLMGGTVTPPKNEKKNIQKNNNREYKSAVVEIHNISTHSTKTNGKDNY